MFQKTFRLDLSTVNDANILKALTEYKNYYSLPDFCAADLDSNSIKEYIVSETDTDIISGWRCLLLMMKEHSVSEFLIYYN